MRRNLAKLAVTTSVLASVVACGKSEPPLLGLDSPGAGDGGASGGDGEAGGLLLTSGNDGCSDAAKLVYVIDEDATLHAFLPSTLTFTTIGTLHCPAAAGAFPNSMAIDRSATAWVNYTSGEIFRVSTADASCQATGYVPDQLGLGLRYGMGFASNIAGSQAETLYVIGSVGDASDVGRGLAWIDTTLLSLTRIGDFSGALAGETGELTGTGTGALYGFFATAPATLAQIDTQTGATSSPQTLGAVSTGQAYAFSFWGGDFWFYTAATGHTSSVTRLAASSDDALTTVASEIGFVIDGAGVSTCAPTTPVR